jgi:hypothetical protein
MYEDFVGCDFLTVVIGRQQVEAGDISEPLSVLLRLLTRENAIQYCERVDICVEGYDSESRELYEIPEVRDFIYQLDVEFPYWLYFLTKRGLGLLFVLSCFCPPFLPPEARQRIWNERIGAYLLNRGFPALNHICELAGCSEQEIRRLSDRVAEYLVNGRDVSEA